MGQVSGNTGGVDDIVEGELVDERGVLEEEGQRLLGAVISFLASVMLPSAAHTWPIPPAAPRTAIHIVSSELHLRPSSFHMGDFPLAGCVHVLALTMMTFGWGSSDGFGSVFGL